MTAKLIDGKTISADLRGSVTDAVHRLRRDRSMKASVLDELPGVGPARKRVLLRHFGSPERFLGATREELEAVPGLPGKVARQIHEQLNRTG